VAASSDRLVCRLQELWGSATATGGSFRPGHCEGQVSTPQALPSRSWWFVLRSDARGSVRGQEDVSTGASSNSAAGRGSLCGGGAHRWAGRLWLGPARRAGRRAMIRAVYLALAPLTSADRTPHPTEIPGSALHARMHDGFHVLIASVTPNSPRHAGLTSFPGTATPWHPSTRTPDVRSCTL